MKYAITRRADRALTGQADGIIEADSVVIDPEYNNLEFYTGGRLIGGVNSSDWITFVEHDKGKNL